MDMRRTPGERWLRAFPPPSPIPWSVLFCMKESCQPKSDPIPASEDMLLRLAASKELRCSISLSACDTTGSLKHSSTFEHSPCLLLCYRALLSGPSCVCHTQILKHTPLQCSAHTSGLCWGLLYLLLHQCLIGGQQPAEFHPVQAAQRVILRGLKWQPGRCAQLPHQTAAVSPCTVQSRAESQQKRGRHVAISWRSKGMWADLQGGQKCLELVHAPPLLRVTVHSPGGRQPLRGSVVLKQRLQDLRRPPAAKSAPVW